VRSEYAPAFFGPLYPRCSELKAAFDPYNQLNPGKIATPRPARARCCASTRYRCAASRSPDRRARVAKLCTAVHCNGNGACYNFDPDDAMCPSWKGTRERSHSPKGRASLHA
jgi:hypothetical protein